MFDFLTDDEKKILVDLVGKVSVEIESFLTKEEIENLRPIFDKIREHYLLICDNITDTFNTKGVAWDERIDHT